MDDHTAKAIIFDFDGTIADSFAVSMFVLSRMGKDKQRSVGFSSSNDVSKLRGMSGKQMLHELKIPLWRVFFLATRTRRLIGEHFDEVTIIPGITDALDVLAKRYDLYILSANSVANVRTFLEKHGIASHFMSTYGGVAPWGKARALRKLLRDHKLTAQDTWYVGDSDLDVKAAHRARMKVAAVSWGYSNIHMLKKHHPDELVFNSDELVHCFIRGK